MEAHRTIETVNIRPGVAILSVLRHLNYRPWFAMAEFVDNSLQSFIDYKKELQIADGDGYGLRVDIEFDPIDHGRITIRDNAAGIHEADYARAFRPAALPTNQNGLCEFGMGMKSAACWFAADWTVRTSALGEPTERTVVFDIDSIVQDSLEELSVRTGSASSDSHYTEIVLSHLHKPPYGRTLGKIKEHLASIYRVFIRDGLLTLRFDGVPLAYEEPKVLRATYFRDASGPPIEWRKDIDFDLGLGLRVHGFAGLRDTASTTHAGFALFRRHRLIQGSADEGYRPETIFGKPNSYAYQRLFGELDLEGFEVSHTKDGFQWDENEETFLDLLKEHLNDSSMPLLAQAEGYRVRQKSGDWKKAAELASLRTAEVIETEVPRILEKQVKEMPQFTPPPTTLPSVIHTSRRVIDADFAGMHWQIILELTEDPAVGDWVGAFDACGQMPEPYTTSDEVRRIGVRLALAHPFMQRFCSTDAQQLEPLLRLAAAIVLAETSAREGGAKSAGTVRHNINELLRDALSKP